MEKAFILLNEKGNPMNNQIIVRNKKSLVELISYGTSVCKCNGNNISLSNYWNYSRTTIKAVKLFIKYCTGIDVNKKYIEHNIDNKVYKTYKTKLDHEK